MKQLIQSVANTIESMDSHTMQFVLGYLENIGEATAKLISYPFLYFAALMPKS